ncbi:MAG: GntR family transcriptional regulator [Lachnospiraceae bacterium]|nr:GntR family transcriptional regulator [Lachnospiraceae bacterium]
MARYNNLRFEKTIDEIEEYIFLNNLQEHEVLPSERKLSELLAVSRGTLREAIIRMCTEGRLYSIQGKGNFVAPVKERIDMGDMISFSRSVELQSKVPGSRFVKMYIEDADERVMKTLQVTRDERVYILSRVRTINGNNILLEVTHIPVKYCKGLEEHDFKKESLYEVLQQSYGITMKRQDITVRLSKAAEMEARLLNISTGSSVFVERAIAFSKDDIPIEYTKTIVNAERAYYSVSIMQVSV